MEAQESVTEPMMQSSAHPSRCLLVLGMHRSGTSALTRTLNLLGADISAKLMDAGAGNEKGFWESVEVYQIHEQLFAELGHNWQDVSPLPVGWMQSEAAARAAEALTPILLRDFAASSLWVVKDPRMCRLVPLWRRVLLDLNVEPMAVVVARHPDEVVASLQKMVGVHYRIPKDAAYGDLLWTTYLLDTERDTRGMPRCLVTYDELLADWEGTVGAIETGLGIAWPRERSDAWPEIASFLSTSQRHHLAPFQESDIPTNLAHRLYMACCVPGPTSRFERIAQLRKCYDDAMDTLGAGFEQWIARLIRELDVGERSRAEAERKLSENGEELYQARLGAMQQTAQIKQLQEELSEQQALVASRSEELYAARLDLLQREAELQQTRQVMEEQALHIQARDAALISSEAELVSCQAERDEQSALAHRLSAELAAMTEKRIGIERVLTELVANLADRRWLFKKLLSRRNRS
ncbi:hypothetical protein [Dyella sp.]|uniref:sulfotransferase family protein n=1 Tax=Dyella sp. TaxID=1869338 RepID=UPI002ED3BDD2